MPNYDDSRESELMILEALVSGTHEGQIERAEAQGQRDLVNSTDLPRLIKDVTWSQLTKNLGIVFGENVNDLFVSVTLPDGWEKQATDHSMWSNLVDDKGRVRGMMFYKAAFYDRDAFMSLDRFYKVGGDYSAREVKIEDANGNVVKDFGRIDVPDDHDDPTWNDKYDEWIELGKTAKAWLLKNYPDYKNVFAYWD